MKEQRRWMDGWSITAVSDRQHKRDEKDRERPLLGGFEPLITFYFDFW